jgi:hypothetical protein
MHTFQRHFLEISQDEKGRKSVDGDEGTDSNKGFVDSETDPQRAQGLTK